MKLTKTFFVRNENINYSMRLNAVDLPRRKRYHFLLFNCIFEIAPLYEFKSISLCRCFQLFECLFPSKVIPTETRGFKRLINNLLPKKKSPGQTKICLKETFPIYIQKILITFFLSMAY